MTCPCGHYSTCSATDCALDILTAEEQAAWDAYYTRFDDGWTPTADEVEAQTAANAWRAEHEHAVTLDDILEARGDRYGRFADNADISQSLKETIQHHPMSLW